MKKAFNNFMANLGKVFASQFFWSFPTFFYYRWFIQPLTRRILNMFGNITRSKGKLKNRITRKESTFDIGNDFNIKPVINLDEHIEFNEETNMFEQIENYCFQLLEDELIDEIFNRNAAIER